VNEITFAAIVAIVTVAAVVGLELYERRRDRRELASRTGRPAGPVRRIRPDTERDQAAMRRALERMGER